MIIARKPIVMPSVAFSCLGHFSPSDDAEFMITEDISKKKSKMLFLLKIGNIELCVIPEGVFTPKHGQLS
jgi:hypothetical protein